VAQSAALLAPLGLVPLFIEQRHIYDLPTLFLFTLALYLLARNDFGKYLVAFAITTFSKETSLFLFLLFAIQFRKMERRTFLKFGFVQLLVYVVIRLGLIVLYRDNPGSLLEFHLWDHLPAYLQYPLPTIVLFCAILGIVGIGILHLRDESPFLRNALLVIGVPTLVLYFVFGVPFEVRVFFEAYPAVFLLIAESVTQLLSWGPLQKAARLSTRPFDYKPE
jgi:hypothetical protein